MIFTRRTYRVAIKRSVQVEAELRQLWHKANTGSGRLWFTSQLNTQSARTARLQRRKRRERK